MTAKTGWNLVSYYLTLRHGASGRLDFLHDRDDRLMFSGSRLQLLTEHFCAS